MVDRRVSRLWGQASKRAKADQGALPALQVLLSQVRQTSNKKSLTRAKRHDAIPSHWPALITAWKDAFQHGKDGLRTAMAPPKSGVWEHLREESSANPRSTAEVQLLWELRQALRRRTVHVPSSLSFKSRAKMLDPGDSSIRAPRSEYPVIQMLKELIAEIEFGLERVSEGAERGQLKIDGTKITVRRLTAHRTATDLKGVRRELYAAYPRVQFPDLIMAVDAETHLSAEILGRPADNETELLHLYSGILG